MYYNIRMLIMLHYVNNTMIRKWHSNWQNSWNAWQELQYLVMNSLLFDILGCKSNETIHVSKFTESYNICTLHHESDFAEVTTASDIITGNMSYYEISVKTRSAVQGVIQWLLDPYFCYSTSKWPPPSSKLLMETRSRTTEILPCFNKVPSQPLEPGSPALCFLSNIHFNTEDLFRLLLVSLKVPKVCSDFWHFVIMFLWPPPLPPHIPHHPDSFSYGYKASG